MQPSWLNKRSRIYWYDQYALNEQACAFRKYDPDRIAAELVSTGADIIALYAANQFSVAYYPSSIWPQHPNLRGRDYVGDILERLRAHGKKVILYVNWLDSRHPEWRIKPLASIYPSWITAEHPEVRSEKHETEAPLAAWADPADRDSAPRALGGGKWYTPCFNSPKRREILRITREIAGRYHPDGFHIDMLVNSDVCVCRYCMPSLTRICGTDRITPPVIKANWNKFIVWRCDSGARILARATGILRKHGIIAAHNLFAPLYIDALWGQDQNWLPSADIFLSECFDAFLLSSTDLNSTSVNVRWQHGAGKIPWILRTSAPSHYSHWPITDAQWRIYAAAAKANGCKAFGPCGTGAYPDTTSPRKLLDGVRQAFDFYMEDADLEPGSVSQAEIAVVFSWATRRFQEICDPAWRDEFNGWARLLMEEHLHYDVMVAENLLSAKDLARYRLVILPDTVCMTKKFRDAIRAFIAAGGSVLATADTSMKNEYGRPAKNFLLGRELGISANGMPFEANFAVNRSVEPEPAAGRVRPVKTRGKTLAALVETDPAGSVAGGTDPLPATVTDIPLATSCRFGKGRGVYAAFGIGRYFEKHGFEHTGKWMMELIRLLLPKNRIEIEAPRTVEVTVRRQARLKRTVLHIANRTVPWTLPTDKRQIGEIVPVSGIKIKMKSPCAKPAVSFRRTGGRARNEKGVLRIRLSMVEAYAAVVIEE